MEKLAIEWGGYTFLEPMALVLNWVLMMQSFYYYHKLKTWRFSNFSIYWRWFFLLFGFSTLFGGPSHFLYAYTGLSGKIPGWIAAALAITFMEQAMCDVIENDWAKRLKILSLVKLAVTGTLLLIAFNFNTIILHTSGMAIFTIFPAYHLLSQNRSDINYIIGGVLALILTLPFRLLGVDFHQWFNRDDIAHILMMITLYFFFKGVKFRESRSPAWELA